MKNDVFYQAPPVKIDEQLQTQKICRYKKNKMQHGSSYILHSCE